MSSEEKQETSTGADPAHFTKLAETLESSGVPAALDFLAETLEAEKKFPQLFEALLMKKRHELGLPIEPSDSPIQPLLLGGEAQAVAVSNALLARGVLVGAIRPPTVAPGTSRLRITLTAGHDEAQVDALLGALAAVLPAADSRRSA